MTSYNNPLRTFFATAALVLLGIACARSSSPRVPKTDSSGDSADSTFVVDTPIRLVQSKQSNGSASWSIPTKNSMTFRACIKDIAKLQPIVSQAFVVHGADKSQELVTDPTGCVNWTEDVAFDGLQAETYIQSEHWIEGAGGPYRGKRHLPLAVDPWLTGEDALMDLRQGSKIAPKLAHGGTFAEALRMARLSEPQDSGSQVVLPSITLQSNDLRYNGDSATLDLELVLKPTLSRKTLSGTVVQEPIHSGAFRLSMTLVERNPDRAKDQLIILAENTLSVSLENDLISVAAPLQLKQKPLGTSILELAFELVPVDAPSDIRPQEGRIRLSGLLGGTVAPVLQIEETLPNYLARARANSTTLKAQGRDQSLAAANSAACSDGSDQLGFFLSSIRVENQGVASRAESASVPNAVLAGFTVCLATTIDRKPVADHGFEVQVGAAPRMLKTDVNGCVRFAEPVNFDYYAAEGWTPGALRITSHEAPFQEVSREFPLWIDPWASDDRFFWDCRRGEKPAFNTQAARLEMVDFGYSFQGRELEIDPAMNLTLKRHYQFQITPRLVRSDGYGGINRYETVADGRFHMRVLLLTPNRDENLSMIQGADDSWMLSNFRYLSSYEADVQARDGRVVQDVTLPVLFQEQPLLATRNAILVQLTPADPSSSLDSQPYYSPFLASAESGGFGLAPSSTSRSPIGGEKMFASRLDLGSLVELGKKSKSAISTEGSELAALASRGGLAQATDSQLAAAGITPAVLRSLLAAPNLNASLAQKLCGLVSPATSCPSNPLASLEIVRVQHIEAVDAQPSVIESKYTPITVAATLAYSQADTHSSSNGSTSDTRVGESAGTEWGTSTDKYSGMDMHSSHDTHSSVDTQVGVTAQVGVDAHAGVSAAASEGLDIFGNSAKLTEDAGVSTHVGVTESAGITESSGTGSSTGVTESSGVSRRESVGFRESRGLSRGKSWFNTVQVAASRISASAASISFNRNFGIEELRFAIRGSTRLCIAVRERKAVSGGLLVCERAADRREWTENYYLVSELLGLGGSSLRDARSQSDAPWVKAIRGKAAFEAFRSALADQSRGLVLSPARVDFDGVQGIGDAAFNFGRTTPKSSDDSLPAVVYY